MASRTRWQAYALTGAGFVIVGTLAGLLSVVSLAATLPAHFDTNEPDPTSFVVWPHLPEVALWIALITGFLGALLIVLSILAWRRGRVEVAEAL